MSGEVFHTMSLTRDEYDFVLRVMEVGALLCASGIVDFDGVTLARQFSQELRTRVAAKMVPESKKAEVSAVIGALFPSVGRA